MQKQQKEQEQFEVVQGYLKFEKSGAQELLQLICLCKPNLMK